MHAGIFRQTTFTSHKWDMNFWFSCVSPPWRGIHPSGGELSSPGFFSDGPFSAPNRTVLLSPSHPSLSTDLAGRL